MSRYTNPVFDCSGARMRAQSRRLATIVTISGDINTVNVDRVTEHARHYVLAANSVVLDLSGVTMADECVAELLDALDVDCATAGVDWVLIAGTAVLDALHGTDGDYPIAASVPEALGYFADETLRRRTLLLPLLTKSA